MSFIRKLFGGGPDRATEDPPDRGTAGDDDLPAAGDDFGGRPRRRYLEFVSGSSAKFYAVVLAPAGDEGWAVAFNFGRIGAPRSWDRKIEGVDFAAGRQAFDELVAEKERKGYERQPWPATLAMPDDAAGDWRDGGGEPAAPRTATIFVAEGRGELPPPTGGQVAGVRLPPGRLFHPDPGGGPRGSGPVVWISLAPVADLSRTWSALAGAFAGTGLWPLMVDPDRGLDRFDEILLDVPQNKSTDVAGVLRHWWRASLPVDGEEFDEETYAPFRRAFPGLASRTPGERPASIDALVRGMKGHLGLVAVERPADVPGVIGWSGAANYDADPFEQSLLLRSWEDRFDAYLVGLGFDTLVLAVARPPRDRPAATAVAAEHLAFCPDNIWQGAGSIGAYAAELAGAGAWHFWWD